MLRKAGKWAMRLVLLAAVAAVVARIAASRSRENGAVDTPVIGGDTWPPVPTKRAGSD